MPFAFFGCFDSNRYFEPKNIIGHKNTQGSIGAYIKQVTYGGATLDDGSFITDEGFIPKVKFTKDYIYINKAKHYYIGANDCGDVIFLHKNSEKSIKKQFNNKVLSIAKKGDMVVALLSNNSIVIKDFQTDKIINSYDSVSSIANTNITALPIFLKDSILVPTLDGKIIVFDANANKIIKSIIVGIVSQEPILNNIIFLRVIDDTIVAATSNNILSLSNNIRSSKKRDITNIIFLRDHIYVFGSEGKISLFDEKLNEQKSIEFPFAQFACVLAGKYIYAIDKGGNYLIAFDSDLKNKKIYDIGNIKTSIFATNKKIYFNNSYIDLE